MTRPKAIHGVTCSTTAVTVNRCESLSRQFVDDDVRVNDEDVGLHGYIAGLEAVGAAFPDFRWELRHLLVNAPWIAAHFTDTGTHREGAPAWRRPAAPSASASSRSTAWPEAKLPRCGAICRRSAS